MCEFFFFKILENDFVYFPFRTTSTLLDLKLIDIL